MQNKQFYQQQKYHSSLQSYLESSLVQSSPRHSHSEHHSKFNDLKSKISHKIFQVQNRSKFFQGQLDGLLSQNNNLKRQMIQLNRMVISSTEMLRNLLPEPSDPEKKIQLKLANIQGISNIIKLDWHKMQADIAQFKRQIQRKQQIIYKLQSNQKEIQQSYQIKIKEITQSYQFKNGTLTLKVTQLEQKLKQTIQYYVDRQQKYFKAKLTQLQKLRHQYASYKKQSSKKQSQYLAIINRLKSEIAINDSEYEKGKNLLKQIYEGKMKQKQQQLIQMYETLFKKKDQQIKMQAQQLNKVISYMREQLVNKDHKLEQKNKKLDQLQQKNKQFQNIISLREKSIKQLLETINIYKKDMIIKNQQINLMKQQIKNLQNKLTQASKKIRQKQERIDNLTSQIQTINTKTANLSNYHLSKLNEKQKQIDNILKKLSLKQQYIQQIKKQYENKIQILSQQSLRVQEQNQVKLNQCIKKLKNKDKQIQLIHKQYEDNRKNNDAKFQKLLSQALNKNQIEWSNKIISIQKDYMNRIKGIQNQNEINLKNKQKEYLQINKKIQQKLNQLQTKSMKMIQDYENKLKQNGQMYSNLSTLLEKIQKQNLQLIQKHEAELGQLKNEQNLNMQKMQLLLDLKSEEFLKKMKSQEQQYKLKLENKQKQHKLKVQGLQNNINILKSKNAVAEIQNKYLDIINKMKDSAEKQKQRLQQQKQMQLKEISNKYQNKIIQINENYEIKLKETIFQYEKQLNNQQQKYKKQLIQQQNKYHNTLAQIQKKLHKNITSLNQQLLSQKQAHNFTKMSTQQKIIYLLNQIQQIKTSSQNKQKKICQLQYIIQQNKKQLSKIDELINEKMKKKRQQYEIQLSNYKKQCERIVNKANQECSWKIKQVEIERVKFTQSLYKDFHDIKNKYENQIRTITQKYTQLQTLFEQRPSREQDLNQIKYLTQVKQKMNQQVRECKKKIANANQIVKYLGMQYQNYKDVYDIFGPQGSQRKFQVSKVKNQQMQVRIRQHLANLAQKQMSKLSKESIRSKQSEQQKRQYPNFELNVREMLKNRRANSQMKQVQFKNYQRKMHKYNTIQEHIPHQEPQTVQIKPFKLQTTITQYQNQQYDNNLIKHKQKQKKFKLLRNINDGDHWKERYNEYRIKDRRKQIKQKQISENSEKQQWQQYQADKSNQLKNNAQMLMSLIKSDKKPPIQLRKINNGYKKMERSKKNNNKEITLGIDSKKDRKSYLINRVATIDSYNN